MLIHCPPGLTAKGRNGYIVPETIRVEAEIGDASNGQPAADITIEIRSRRLGDAAPIILAGPPVELCAVLQAMIDAVAEEATLRQTWRAIDARVAAEAAQTAQADAGPAQP